MTVTFSGTITKNLGQSPAVGTVTITPAGGSPTVETLDAAGHFSVAIAGGQFSVEEELDGPLGEFDFTVSALDATTVDLSRDTGRVGVGATDVEPVVAFQAAVATANATDLATAEALANATKAAHNALVAAMIAAGVMAAS